MNPSKSVVSIILLYWLLTTPIAFVSAAEICKTVDKDGNVTFADCSSTDLDSTRVEVNQGPSEAEILEAKEQAKKQMDDIDQLTGSSDSSSLSLDKPHQTSTEKSQQHDSGTKTRLSREEINAKQIALDQQCQIAREKILSVERAQYVDECVQSRSKSTREECERFYADHGNATTERPPLYFDLPECVEAYEFRQNSSR